MPNGARRIAKRTRNTAIMREGEILKSPSQLFCGKKPKTANTTAKGLRSESYDCRAGKPLWTKGFFVLFQILTQRRDDR